MVQLFPAKIWNGLAIINFIFFPCPPPPPPPPPPPKEKTQFPAFQDYRPRYLLIICYLMNSCCKTLVAI